MKMQYFFGIIEVDTEKLDENTGKQVIDQMAGLKELIDGYGSCDYYQIKDVAALKRFVKEIKRLNP